MPFKVEFGNLSGKQFYSSSQNLFKLSQRKVSFGIVLADVCKQVGLGLFQDPDLAYSGWINLHHTRIAVAFASKRQKIPAGKCESYTRMLRSQSIICDEKSRTSLAFTGKSSSMSTPSEKEEEMLRRLNVDDLSQMGVQGMLL